MVECSKKDTVPITFLDRDFVPKSLFQIVSGFWWKTSEFDGCLGATDCIHPCCQFWSNDTLDSIQVGLSFVMILLIANTSNECTRLMLNKAKRTASVDILGVPLIPMGIQVLLGIDDIERCCQGWNERS